MTDVFDAALIGRVAAGDRAAMRSLYAGHATRTLRFLIRLVGDRSLAEDLMTETFSDVWRQAARFEGSCSVSTWLLSIARFRALSAPSRDGESGIDPRSTEAIGDEVAPSDFTLQKSGEAHAVRRCLQGLSVAQREVIDLVYYHERSIDEVGVILGAPADTVKTRMFHARKRLAELLAAAGAGKMAISVKADGRAPHEADLLAPWRAVDKLGPDDARAFDRAVRDDPDAARRLDAAIEERDAAIDLNEALPQPSPTTRDTLFARIEAEQTRSASAKLSGAGRWLAGRTAGLSPSMLGWGAAAAALVIAVQAGLVATGYFAGRQTGFAAASAGPGAAPTNRTALVGFQPAATAEEIAALLREIGAEIVAGPKSGGAFVVRLGGTATPEAEFAAAIEGLRKRTAVVRFAAPGETAR